jgi:[methyl-Co(III) methanol-specific corrinoid protein]:coenzyme M methyltransferase
MTRSRDETLALLHGERIGRVPVFSGLPSLTNPGLAGAGVAYHSAHDDPARMAAAAASTFELFGFESAVVPFDICVEAEALGCGVDFQRDVDFPVAPVVSAPLSLEAYSGTAVEIENAGRVPIVADAIGRLKAGVGREIAIGAWVPGPFTLAGQMFGVSAWLTSLNHPRVSDILRQNVQLLQRVARRYLEAGADFITVHEMGGSPQAIGSRAFGEIVRPALVRLFDGLTSPKVLSICGDTNAIVAELASCGADGIHVDQRNDLARTRRLVGNRTRVFGNVDPIGALSRGKPEMVAQRTRSIVQAGADAVWPGCDLYPDTPGDNMRAMISTAR